jgi:hypothetical protein
MSIHCTIYSIATIKRKNRLEGKEHMPLLTVQFIDFVATRKMKRKLGLRYSNQQQL